MGEILYNGIKLPEIWPPYPRETDLDAPLPVPYLHAIPEIIPIQVGRQLFVDDFLIENTTLKRKFHQARLVQDKPVFFPETSQEMNGGFCPLACPFKDGIFYDDGDQKFKMWYHSGWFDGTSYAESSDGIHWNRLEELGEALPMIPHTERQLRDGCAVWLDYNAPAEERYKLFLFYREFDRPIQYFHQMRNRNVIEEYGNLYCSADGIHWKWKCRTSPCGDNTSFFYNPFRKKWVYSIRYNSKLLNKFRIRGYYETASFWDASWKKEDIRFWQRADRLDQADPRMEYIPQLYNMDATPYESIMLGEFGIFLGPPNEICEQAGLPKIIDIKLGFSRDGFHWHRPDREPFLRSSRIKGTWNYGYLHPANGLCLVVGEHLYFYFSAFSGRSPQFGYHMYAGGSTGLAVLRRDGFASMEDDGFGGELVTRKLIFQGKDLYINAESNGGEIRAEMLDEANQVIKGFSLDDCIPAQGNLTKQKICWKGNPSLEPYSQKPIRFRFYCRNAKLYSFWVSPKESGASMGYMAAGGPGFYHGMDVL